MKKLGCLIVLCYLLIGAGLVWSLPPITSNSTGTASDNNTIRSVATQLVIGGTLPSASVGDGNFTVDNHGSVLMRTASYIRDTANPFCQQFYAGIDYDDNYTEICAPATGYTETYSLRLPTAAPTSNQVMVFPVPTAGVSQGTWGSAAGTGVLISTNNLSDLTDNATARSNLGLEVGVDVAAYVHNHTSTEPILNIALRGGGSAISTGSAGNKRIASAATITLIQAYGPFEPETAEEYGFLEIEAYNAFPPGWVNGL